jgi:hypothetical protein
MASRYAQLRRADLAVLVPELLLCGHLIDRSGMAWALAEFGPDGMVEVAVEEWSAASPIYTKRMQRALAFEGTDVTTIFKGLQLDIGAPPQFMDFRYRVDSPSYGEFWLDHCGALLDVEPMGEQFVVGMCHHIEDPTFDATAIATNPKARMRPIHRPPRTPVDRQPHCHWTVTIEEDQAAAEPVPMLAQTSRTNVATLALDGIDPSSDGALDYAGPLLSDLDFAAFSHSALTRIADEVCVQHHLLNLSFLLSVRAHLGSAAAAAAAAATATDATDATDSAREIGTKQLTGIAGLTAERIHRAMHLAHTPAGAVSTLALHPVFNPAAYVDATFEGDTVRVRRSAAHDDGAWIALCGPHSPAPLQAMVRAVDPHFDVEMTGTEDSWDLKVIVRAAPAAEVPEVQITRFSGGAAFAFVPRTSLPLTTA